MTITGCCKSSLSKYMKKCWIAWIVGRDFREQLLIYRIYYRSICTTIWTIKISKSRFFYFVICKLSLFVILLSLVTINYMLRKPIINLLQNGFLFCASQYVNWNFSLSTLPSKISFVFDLTYIHWRCNGMKQARAS